MCHVKRTRSRVWHHAFTVCTRKSMECLTFEFGSVVGRNRKAHHILKVAKSCLNTAPINFILSDLFIAKKTSTKCQECSLELQHHVQRLVWRLETGRYSESNESNNHAHTISAARWIFIRTFASRVLKKKNSICLGKPCTEKNSICLGKPRQLEMRIWRRDDLLFGAKGCTRRALPL